ncbi:PspA/IM30 family protein [Paracrocinitomix mangrovi]|uniref:PspA/IM30 family protein n=1 Tax=Paracrocinitomix mangrovi TaxID=2862509 RepID=UPI001C8E78E0|nr:PspA/IM30 family protein [Paracrocinitomix mangrovi]UKN01917.1 PspA/IM30 family protein [Paracrocinitomix mangrovi]
MNIFKRLFKIGQAEANSAVDKLEDPIKMTEQGIRDLKKDLSAALQAMAEVKALAIRAKNDAKMHSDKASDYERKAVMLLKRAEKGEITLEEADRLASECLVQQETHKNNAATCLEDQTKFEGNVSKLDGNIKTLKSNIKKFEVELKTLKARSKVSKATKKINEQMAGVDSSSTVAMLERMKDKVAEEEALAESYAEIAGENKSIDEEIDSALDSGSAEVKASDSLAALKAKLGMGGAGAETGSDSSNSSAGA